MTLNPKEVLKETFGYEEFRQGQNKIINSIKLSLWNLGTII